MLVKLPIHESTLLNSFGRSHATVKRADAAAAGAGDRAACGVVPKLHGLLDFRQDLLQQKARVLIGERVVLEAAVGAAVGARARLMKMPTVTGMSPLAIRLSKTVGT